MRGLNKIFLEENKKYNCVKYSQKRSELSEISVRG